MHTAQLKVKERRKVGTVQFYNLFVWLILFYKYRNLNAGSGFPFYLRANIVGSTYYAHLVSGGETRGDTAPMFKIY